MNAKLRRTLTGYAFVSPWIIALVVFISYPFLSGLFFSFCDYPPLKQPMFVGVENYTELFGDAQFRRSLWVTLVFSAVAIPLGVLAALTLAMLLNARIRGQSFYRVIYYLPHLVPTVVVAILWKWIFNPEFGLFNTVLKWVLGPVNGWTRIWFDLDRAAAGGNFFRPQGWALPAAVVATVPSVKSRTTIITTQPHTAWTFNPSPARTGSPITTPSTYASSMRYDRFTTYVTEFPPPAITTETGRLAPNSSLHGEWPWPAFIRNP